MSVNTNQPYLFWDDLHLEKAVLTAVFRLAELKEGTIDVHSHVKGKSRAKVSLRDARACMPSFSHLLEALNQIADAFRIDAASKDRLYTCIVRISSSIEANVPWKQKLNDIDKYLKPGPIGSSRNHAAIMTWKDAFLSDSDGLQG
jgi:hypothetical protein